MCTRLCVCMYVHFCMSPTEAHITPHRITSLTPEDESGFSFSSQKVPKLFASIRPWLLSCWLRYWNEFSINNFPLWTNDLTLCCSNTNCAFCSVKLSHYILVHKLEIVSKLTINATCVVLTEASSTHSAGATGSNHPWPLLTASAEQSFTQTLQELFKYSKVFTPHLCCHFNVHNNVPPKILLITAGMVFTVYKDKHWVCNQYGRHHELQLVSQPGNEHKERFISSRKNQNRSVHFSSVVLHLLHSKTQI